MDRPKEVCEALVRRAWPQLVTLVGFVVATSLRFPVWFIVVCVAVIGTAVWRIARRIPAQRPHIHREPTLGLVLIGAGLASIALTMKWWFVEKQMRLAAGTLLNLAGHTEMASGHALEAWASVLTQWGSCVIFLVIAVVWGLASDMGE
ncbi:hypothetical protein [Paraburkholderia solisilvae]|uniref:hypothetical protein n=1 Tax=Paraburkholderia solisilvae TaxID=624376 RepID=UPI001FE4D4D9|nr:hypothetical protein [Paraburkholderia solisilvae]